MTLLLLLLAQDPLPEKVRPIFREFCWDCHGDGAGKGGFAIDGYRGLDALLADRKRWAKAQLLLQSRVMPPIQKPQPSDAQRRDLLEWIDRAVFPVDPERPDPGHTVLRRLNRAEYNNAVRDVFGVASRPADAFPPDDSGYGFDTIGDVLTLSPALLEKVLAAARQVADEATRPGAVGQAGVERFGSQLQVFRGEATRDRNVLQLREGAEAGIETGIHADAVYRVLVIASGGPLEVLSDGERIHTFAFDPAAKPPFKTAWALLPLKAGRRRIAVRGAGASIQAFRLRGPFNPVAPPPPPFLPASAPLPRLVLSGEDTEAGEGKSSLDTGAAWFSTTGYRHAPLAIRQAGRYRFRVKAGAQQVGDERVRFELRVAGRTLGPFTVSAAEQRHEWIEAEAELEAGDHSLQFHFVNGFRDEATKAERWFWLHEYTVEGPLRPDDAVAHADVPGHLARAARRLFRRPVSKDEEARLADLAKRAERAGLSPMGALRQGLVALLASPSFLYWNAPIPAGPPERGSVAIDEVALASRLSAFLWSSVPDEELLALAEAGGLRKAFRAQVVRMLADPKAKALTENFAGQWLELRNMTLVTPDAAVFPGWNAALAADLRRETELLFEHLLRENRPVLELLSADYTFANARVAAHYGIPGVEGDAFRRVSLEGTPRRGILTHASLLTISSHPNRTSPVKRGKFILEKILGTPPPPAPRDVPPLPEDTPEVRGLTMRQRLEAHRKNPACASCHAFMDPPGFAFEHYDAIGRRRETDEGRPVDAAGTLATGGAFKDAEEFRLLLVRDRSDDIVRALAEQLLTYAIGRGVEYTDKTALAGIAAGARRSHELIIGVCESVPFQRMRVPGAK
jgi:hypothetical protein